MADDGSGPLRFSREDIDRIAKTLAAFLKNAAARAVLLVDRDGRVLISEGASSTVGADLVSRIVASSFESDRRLSGLLGEEGFSSLYHQRGRDNVQLSLVDERTVLVVVFDEHTTIGMIRLYSEAIAGKLAEFFRDLHGRGKKT